MMAQMELMISLRKLKSLEETKKISNQRKMKILCLSPRIRQIPRRTQRFLM